MLHIGRARHPGPGKRSFIPGQLSIEFANIGGWLTYGDLAMDSCAQFLAIAEHRLIPARARSVGHQLRRAGFHSVWAPACQDTIPGGHAGVGVENHSSYWKRRSGSSLCCLWISRCGGGC